MIINNIKIGDIIIRDIEKLIKENIFFTTYDIFKILDNYLYQKQMLQLLSISQSTYYKYKRERKNKFVDRKLYEFYLLITNNDNFKEIFEKYDIIYLE